MCVWTKYSISKSQHCLINKKSEFESHCHFYGWIEGWLCKKTLSFEVEGRGEGVKQGPPSILLFGGSCSSKVVVTTSLN